MVHLDMESRPLDTRELLSELTSGR